MSNQQEQTGARTVPSFLRRAFQTAVIWSWLFNFLRFGSVIIVLPLLFRAVSKEEVGFYYMFVHMAQFLAVMDFGFSATIGRFVSYAMSGATRLVPHGVSAAESNQAPNQKLLWELFFTTRTLYRMLATGSLLLITLIGTPFIAASMEDAPRPGHVWAAWALTILATASEIYSVWSNVFLAGTNRVTASNRILAVSYFVKLCLSALLLVLGAGLLSVPLAGLVSSILQRSLSHRACFNVLEGPAPEQARRVWRQHLAVIWPNTWRLGVQAASRFLVSLSVMICGAVLSAEHAGRLGLSLQMIAVVQSMAMVWTSVKWPLIGQMRARNDLAGLRSLFWPRVWLQTLSYTAGAAVVIALGPMALDWLGTDKEMLARVWLFLIALNGFFETQFTLWSTLISTENRLPYLWPSVAANVGTMALALALLYGTSLEEGAFILAPLLAGLLFNYWHWPIQGARSIQTSLAHFLFSRPRQPI